MNAACPSPDSLRQYSLGDLEDGLAVQIETHLAACPACEETIAQFDSADDTLMRHLPLAAGTADEAADMPGWLEQLQSGPPVGQAARLPLAEQDAPDGTPDPFTSYELLSVLGRGGMGVVYRARHRQLNRNVALKVLSPRLIAAPEARRRFEREIQVLGGLHHPGIVMATDAGRIGEAAYLVMELVDGVDLSRLVRQSGPLSVPEACEAARQIAEALAAAHEAGAVHRDVKPSNAMIDRRGRVKLLDFGLAHLHALSTESLETSLGRLLGTLDYMAPEQAAGDGSPGAGADLYGLGATLFFLLTGRAPRGPREGRSLVQQLRAIVDAEVPRVSTLRADVPPELDDFVARLLSHDPNDRPPSADVVADQLKQWAGGNLAGRVIESKTNHAPDETASENSELVLRSLSELVGPNIARPSQSGLTQRENAAELEGKRNSAETAGLSGGGRRRRWAWAAAAAGAFAAAFYGIVIILQTPNGTLRIESDIDNVEIRVVDEKNAIQDFTVNRHLDVTNLAAGRYRISFKGNHDGIAMDRDVVTLKRGQIEVAKITRTEHSHVAAIPEKYVLGRTERDWQNFLLAHRGLVDIDQSCINCHRQGPLPEVKTIDLPKTADSAPSERMYQGKLESEWRRIFLAEREPTAKLEAAGALLGIAADRPPERQIEAILEVAEAMPWSNSVDENLAFALTGLRGFEFDDTSRGGRGGRGRSFGASGGSRRGRRSAAADAAVQGFGSIRGGARTYLSFVEQVRQMVRFLPSQVVATQLSKAAVEGSENRAALALGLLNHRAVQLSEDPTAAQIAFRTLNVRPRTLDRNAVCQLTRGRFIAGLTGEQQRELMNSLGSLASLLAGVNDREDNLVNTMRDALLESASTFDRWPPETKRDFARVLNGALVLRPEAVVDKYFTVTEVDLLQNPVDGSMPVPPYDPRYIAALRKKTQFFLDEWLPLVNQIDDNRPPPFGAGSSERVRTIDHILALDSDGDDWAAEQTARILTEQLRRYYSTGDGVKPPSDVPPEVILPASPSLMLTQIVRVTGQIPDFVRNGQPRSQAVADRLHKFNAMLVGGSVPGRNESEGLYEDAPLEVIKLSVGSNNHIPIPRGVQPARMALTLATSGSSVSFSADRVIAGRPDLFVDPLLLLAALLDLAGDNQEQDGRIAHLLNEVSTGWTAPSQSDPQQHKQTVGLNAHLRYLLASPLKARQHARRMLNEIATKSKSQELTDAAKALLQSAADLPRVNDAPRNTESAAAPAEAGERLYRGKPISEWPRVFAAETDPAAKLDAAAAVMKLLPEPLGEQQMDTILDIGEVIVRESFGDDALLFAFEPGRRPPQSATRWNLARTTRQATASRRGARQSVNVSGEGTEPDLLTAYRQFQAELNGRVESAPPELLAAKLTDAAMNGSDARAAFALSLLRDVAKPTIEASPAAVNTVVEGLKSPASANDRTYIALLVRANYAMKLQERRQAVEELTGLAESVVKAARGQLRDAFRTELLSFGASTNSWPEETFRQDWPAATQRVFARLVLDEMTDPEPRQPGRFYVDPPPQPEAETTTRSSRGRTNLLPSYDPRYAVARRAATRYFRDEWRTVANEYLTAHNAPPYDDATRQVIWASSAAVNLREPGDDLSAESTASLLTEQLRPYYVTDASAQTDQAVADLLPLKPAEMLHIIALITGDVPDFARTGLPKPKAVGERLRKLEAALSGSLDQAALLQLFEGIGRGAAGEMVQRAEFVDLYNEAPFQVIKLAVSETKARLPIGRGGFGGRGGRTRGRGVEEVRDYVIRPADILQYATYGAQPNSSNQYDVTYVDPLFLLTALATFSGENEAQDERIGQLLRASLMYYSGQYYVHEQLKSLVAGPTTAGQMARQLLTAMAAKSKSADLTRVIQLIDPKISAPAQAEAAK